MAKWIARATWAANNCEEPPYRDTEASQWRAAAAKKEAKAMKMARRSAAGDSKDQDEHDGERDLRGHNPVKVLQLSGIRSGWRCTFCQKTSPKKKLLTSRRCRGCPIVDWSKVDLEDGNGNEALPTQLQQHRRMLSGKVLWCSRCGVYADKQGTGPESNMQGHASAANTSRWNGRAAQETSEWHTSEHWWAAASGDRAGPSHPSDQGERQ